MTPDIVVILIGVFLIGILIGICIGGAIESAAREEASAFEKMARTIHKVGDAKRDLGDHLDDTEPTP